MSALRLINETEITTPTATVQATDVFTSDFDIYKITISDLLQASATTHVYGRFINSADSTITSSNYDYAHQVLRAGGTWQENRQTNGTLFWHTAYNLANASDYGGATFWVFNPYSSSSYTFWLHQSFARYNGISGGTVGFEGYKHIGVLKNTSSVTGIEFFNASSVNFTNLKFNIYGLRVDNG